MKFFLKQAFDKEFLVLIPTKYCKIFLLTLAPPSWHYIFFTNFTRFYWVFNFAMSFNIKYLNQNWVHYLVYPTLWIKEDYSTFFQDFQTVDLKLISKLVKKKKIVRSGIISSCYRWKEVTALDYVKGLI